jgi:hypothetical protein
MKKIFLAGIISLLLCLCLVIPKSESTEVSRWLETGNWDTFCNLINSGATADTVTITFYGQALSGLVSPTLIGSTVATIAGTGGIWQIQAETVVGTSSTWEGGSVIISGEAAGTKGSCFNFENDKLTGFGYPIP